MEIIIRGETNDLVWLENEVVVVFEIVQGKKNVQRQSYDKKLSLKLSKNDHMINFKKSPIY